MEKDHITMLKKIRIYNEKKNRQLAYASLITNYHQPLVLKEKEELETDLDQVLNLIMKINETTLGDIFEECDKNCPEVIDIIILLWCHVSNRPLSKKQYIEKQKKMISTKLQQLLGHVSHNTIRNFVIDVFSKESYVPVYVIDLLWYWIDGLTIEFNFITYEMADLIKIEQDYDNESVTIILSINMQYILDLGLGHLRNIHGVSFRDMIISLITNPQLVNNILQTPNAHNFKTQTEYIMRNSLAYFGCEFNL